MMLAKNMPMHEFLEYASDEELLAAREKLIKMAAEYEAFCDEFDTAEDACVRVNYLESEVGRLSRDVLDYHTALELLDKAHLFCKNVEAGYMTMSEMNDHARWFVIAVDKFKNDWGN